MSNITEDKIKHITNLYINQCTNLAEISRITGVCRPTVRKILRKAGLRQIYKEDIDNSSSLNTNLFDAINDEASAYFLGLMYADGNVYIDKRNNIPVVLLQLQKRDKHILDAFKSLIAPNHKLYLVKSKIETQQDQYRIMFNSKIIGKQLEKLGCVPAKSLKLIFPDCVPSPLVHHFLRGYFDGDGCVSSQLINGKYKSYSVSITSTKTFCQSVQGIFKSEIGINSGVYTRKTNNITSELSSGGNRQVYKLMKWLYRDASIYIQRKHKKFLELEKLTS